MLATACRDSKDSGPSGEGLVPNTAGANGCTGPDQVFTPPQAPVAVPLATLGVGPASHVTADGSSETLYATGADATIVATDACAIQNDRMSYGIVEAIFLCQNCQSLVR